MAMIFDEADFKLAGTGAGAKEAVSDTRTLRNYLDRLRSESRPPNQAELIKAIDGLLQLIERRDEIGLLRLRMARG